nr:trafficking protein particle complex subunit 11-like [Cherax quadricarinatus]
MWDYRSEKWWSLLSSVSALALQCAYNTAAITEYFGLALEFMGTKLMRSEEDKKRVHDNLLKLLNGQSPDPEPGTPPEVVTVATEAWSVLLGSQVSPVTVDMTTLVPCLEVRASFTQSQFHVDQEVGVIVMIRNSYQSAISLSALSVTTNSPSYSDRLLETQPEKLILSPGKVTEIHLTFLPLVEDVGKKVKVTVETQSLKFEKLARVAAGESFLVVPKIKCISHVPITLTNSSLALGVKLQIIQ